MERQGPRVSPWRTLSSREVYRNPWIRVREDAVLRPDGSPGIYGVVSTALAVGVLAVTDADEVVLVGQWRYTLDAHSWELVEGGAHPGEDSLTAARRELAEEAGYEAATWQRLAGDLALSNSVTDERAELWLARDLTAVPASPEPTEDIEVRQIPVAEAVELVVRGEITDVMSVVGLLAYDRRRRVTADPGEPVTLQVVGGPPACRPAARRIAGLATARGLAPDRAADLELAVHEVLVNAVEHGHRGDAGEPIEVTLSWRPGHDGAHGVDRAHGVGGVDGDGGERGRAGGGEGGAGVLRLELTDRNRGRWNGALSAPGGGPTDGPAHPNGGPGQVAAEPSSRGRGLHLARRAVDRLSVRTAARGTTVVLELWSVRAAVAPGGYGDDAGPGGDGGEPR